MASIAFEPKIYPNIGIQVNHNELLQGIQIKISLQETRDAAVLMQELFLAKDTFGFKLDRLKPLVLSIPYLQMGQEKDKCVIYFNGMDDGIRSGVIEVVILKDGTVLLSEMNTQSHLKLEVVSQDIIVANPLVAQSLSLLGRNIVVKNAIQANDLSFHAHTVLNQHSITSTNINFTTTHQMINEGVIEAQQHLKISGLGALYNYRVLRARKRFYLESLPRNESGNDLNVGLSYHSIKFLNKGLVHSPQVLLKVNTIENVGQILSQHSRFNLGVGLEDMRIASFRNKGIIIGKKSVLLRGQGRAVNETEAHIISNGKVTGIEIEAFDNRGEVACQNLLIQPKDYIQNSSSSFMVAEELLLDSLSGKIVNKGTIFSNREAYILAQCLMNQGQILVEGKLYAMLENDIQNQGKIISNLGLECAARENGRFSKDSLFASKKDIHLAVGQNIEVQGKINSESNITTISGQHTHLSKEGSIQANQNLSIKAIQNIRNLGVISGLEGYLRALNGFINEVGGNVAMRRNLNILSHTLVNSGNINSIGQIKINVQEYIKQMFGGTLGSLESISIKVQGLLCNQGNIVTHSLNIWAKDILQNAGLIKSNQCIIKSGCIFDNLLKGIIFAGDQLNLFSKEVFENAGSIQSLGASKIEARHLLNNLKSGKIISKKELKLLAGFVLSNAGQIIGESRVLMEAGHWLENQSTGRVMGNHLELNSDNNFYNEGVCSGVHKVHVKALGILTNYQKGRIHSEKALQLFSNWMIENEGDLSSENLKAEVGVVLNNAKTGSINALKALTLISAALVQNLGQMSSQFTTISAQSMIANLSSGIIEGREALHLLSEFCIKNESLMLGEQLFLDAKSLLSNLGNLQANRELQIKTEGDFVNHGQCQSHQVLNVSANTIHNATAAQLSADSATLLANTHFEQNGTINATEGNIEASSLNNSGHISILKELTMKIKDSFRHCHEGRLEVTDAATIITKNLELMGQLIGEGTITFEVAENLDYDANTQWAIKLLKLKMQNNIHLTKPIHLLGSLEITTPQNIAIHADLKTQNDCYLQAHNLTVDSNHQVVANGALTADITGNYQYNPKNFRGESELHLKLRNFYGVFNTAIETRGGFHLDIPGSFHAEANVGGDCSLKVGALTTDKAHNINIQGSLKAEISGKAVIGSHSSLSSKKELILSAHELQMDGTLSTESNLYLQGGRFHINGNISSNNAFIKGKDIIHRGSLRVRNHLQMESENFEIIQQVQVNAIPFIRNRKVGMEWLWVSSPIQGTGEIVAERFSGEFHTFAQTGGLIFSGNGGTSLIVHEEMNLQPLRTYQVEEGSMSRRGCNYQMIPQFSAASLWSRGSQNLISKCGSIIGLGISLVAGKRNCLWAQNDIMLRGCQEEYELASSGHFSGSSFAVLPVYIEGREGLDIQSRNVELTHTVLNSGRNLQILAKNNLRILSDKVFTENHREFGKRQGLIYRHYDISEYQEEVLPSQISVQNNLILWAPKLHLKAVQAQVGGHTYMPSRDVRIEGDSESSEMVTETDSIGLSFFGSQALEAAFHRSPSRVVFKTLACQDPLLATIHQNGHPMEIVTEGWRLAAGMAQNLNGIQPNMMNYLTGRWKITHDGRFNPSFKLKLGHSTNTEEATHTIASQLAIQGNLYIQSNNVRLLDGAQISAANILIQTRKLFETRAAANSQNSDYTEHCLNTSFRLDGTITGVGGGFGNRTFEQTTYQNAAVTAANSLTIQSQESVVVSGSLINGNTVMISTPRLIAESLQDTYESSHTDYTVSLGSQSSIQIGEGEAHQKWVLSPTTIRANQNLSIRTDHFLQRGAILSAANSLSLRGLTTARPEWSIEDIEDFAFEESTHVSAQFNGNLDGFPFLAFGNVTNNKMLGLTRATVSAPFVNAELPSHINTNLEEAQELLLDKERDFTVPILFANRDGIKREGAAISQRLQRSPAFEDKGLAERQSQVRYGSPENHESPGNQASQNKTQALKVQQLKERKEIFVKKLVSELEMHLAARGKRIPNTELRNIVETQLGNYNSRTLMEVAGQDLYSNDLEFRVFARSRLERLRPDNGNTNSNANSNDHIRTVALPLLLASKEALVLGALAIVWISGKVAENPGSYVPPSYVTDEDELGMQATPFPATQNPDFLWMFRKDHKNIKNAEAQIPRIKMPNPDQFPFDPKDRDKDKIDREIICEGYGRFYHLRDENLWVSRDRAGSRSHGQVAWKAYKQKGNIFEHVFEADDFMNFMNKHKSEIGEKFNAKEKCRGISGKRGL